MASGNYLPFQQPLNYPLLTGTTDLVVSLNDVKIQLRITLNNTDEDTLLTTYIRAATTYFERITGRDLINKTYKTYLNNFPNNVTGYAPLMLYPFSYFNNYSGCDGIIILKSKLQSITSIQYYSDDVLATVDPSIYYITDNTDYAAIFLKNNKCWPTDIDIRQQAIIIILIAGFGTADDVPDDIKETLLLMVTNLYENRGDCGGDCSKLPESVQALITSQKILYM